MAKSGHPLFPWMRSRTLSHMAWHMQTNNYWIAASDRLLRFFFLFSLLTTKVYTCPICLSNQAWLTYSSILGVTWFRDPLPLGLAIMSDPSIWVKKINFFQKHN
jgi:hypothetical protein